MIAWWWVPILLFVGMVCGLMIAAVISANGDDREPQKRWWDQ